jgi:hypothetical protein
MKAYGGVDEFIHVFLQPVFVAEFSASGLGRFNPGETVPIINYLITNI